MKNTTLATNAMITYVAKKFGVSSDEAILMRFKVRAYLLRRGTSYQDCLDTYKALMKKTLKQGLTKPLEGDIIKKKRKR